MRANDGRRKSHRKGVAIGHSKLNRKTREEGSYSLRQMRDDVELGWNHFWNHTKRRHLREGSWL